MFLLNCNVVTPDKREVGKRTDGPLIIQPQAKIVKTEPEVRILKSKWILTGQYKWFEHLDKKWSGTVWWSYREQTWKPRDPSKPIVWARAPDWKPETAEESEERYQKGCRLEHKDVKAKGIHQFFDDPDHKVMVERDVHDQTRRLRRQVCFYRRVREYAAQHQASS